MIIVHEKYSADRSNYNTPLFVDSMYSKQGGYYVAVSLFEVPKFQFDALGCALVELTSGAFFYVASVGSIALKKEKCML